jgi:hypothetical protein
LIALETAWLVSKARLALHRIATAQAAQGSDSAFNALHAAGYSIGDVGGPGGWIVSGHRGEQTIEAHGETQSKAWTAAVEKPRPCRWW